MQDDFIAEYGPLLVDHGDHQRARPADPVDRLDCDPLALLPGDQLVDRGVGELAGRAEIVIDDGLHRFRRVAGDGADLRHDLGIFEGVSKVRRKLYAVRQLTFRPTRARTRAAVPPIQVSGKTAASCI